MNKKEYGLVLAGGGTKGAYQVGVWKALKELEINIKAIVGASIGALNGALFLQDDFNTAIKLYEQIKIEDIMKVEGASNIFNLATNFRKQKGIDNAPLRQMIKQYIDMNKLYNSDIDFGLITYSVKEGKPLQKFKDEIPKEQMEDYLLASSCFPIFKPQNIDGIQYFDGGLYDNTPSNMLIEKGYKNIIIADIAGMGLSRKSVSKDIYVKVISPTEDLGGMFDFDHERIINNIKMGYLDTMKSFNKLQGHIYYFKPSEFAKMLEKFNLQTIYGLEYAAEMYNMHKYKEYTFEEFITELSKRHTDAEVMYERLKKENLIQIGKRLNKLFEKGRGICMTKDLYMDRPASRASKYLFNFVKDYIVAAKALIELKNYIG